MGQNDVPHPAFGVPSPIAKLLVPMVYVVFVGQLFFTKTIKIVATGGQILKLECTKFDFGTG